MVQLRGATVAVIGRRTVPKCPRQCLVDSRLQREYLRATVALLHLLRIKLLKALNALLQPLNPTPFLFNSKVGWL